MIVAFELLLTAAVDTLKVAEVAEAATVADAGTVKAGLVFASVMTAPPVGALCDKVTVQMADAFAPRVADAHDNEDTVTGTAKPTVMLEELSP